MSDVQVDENELGMELTKKRKKTSSKKSKEKEEVNEEELSTIAMEASQLFDANSKKKKKKKSVKKEESTDDNVDEDIGELIESLKKPKRASKTNDEEDEDAAKQSKGSYWTEEEKEDKKDANDVVEFDNDDDKKADFGPASWNASDRDYKYEELLELMYNVLRNKNPGLGVKRSRIRVKPPKVVKDGPRKTIFINFQEICSNLHRQQEHVIAYIFSELSTSGSVAAGQQLIIRGVYRDKDIESVLKKYISDYVLCRVCNSMETILTRDPNTRLYTLNCLSCGANRTVSAVKQSSATVKRSK
ncbi:translation initiation factor 2 subunit beta [Acrasis kona]|uniref:Translation initiation factor 2 subunit beta n=1 Tax=Acrasis kona TaxID=1008807 RepID=A0AAW2YXW7_9EUKA